MERSKVNTTMELELSDRNRLIQILSRSNLLQTRRERAQILHTAGLEHLLPYLMLEGETPIVIIGELVDKLQQAGKLPYGDEALGCFLNVFKEFLGGRSEESDFIDGVLIRYRLMIPTAPGVVFSWHLSPEQRNLEQMISVDTMRDVAFFERAVEISRAIARLTIPLDGSGYRSATGFLVTPSLLVTSHHVVATQEQAQSAVIEFNYQLTSDGHEREVVAYHMRPTGLYRADKRADVAIIELEGMPGEMWGWLPLQTGKTVRRGDRVNIIQHPAGLPKKICVQDNQVTYVDDLYVQYLTSTQAGSSGSPVLDNHWRVVALHHAGISSITHERHNEGIVVGAVLQGLGSEVSARIQEEGHTS